MVATLPHHRPESGLNATLLPIAAILAGIGVAAGVDYATITARCRDCNDTVRPHQPCEVTWNA